MLKIHHPHNCIGLPLKRAFVDGRAPKNWGGLPCHLVDHNPHYTENMHVVLRDKVWQPSIDEAEECEFDAKSLEGVLEEGSDVWRDWLDARGQGQDNDGNGTQYCWENRDKISDTWYIPFSMHPGTPTKREPPPDWNKLSESMKAYLKKMFKAIKS